MAWTRWTQDLWTLSHPLVVGGLHMGARATAVRGPAGVTLISAVPMAEAEVAELRGLGQVESVVAPNLLHHLFAADAVRALGGRMIGPAALAEKGVRLDGALGDGVAPWAGTLEQVVVQGVPKMGETVFFHPPSRTLVVTDLCFNVVRSDSWFTRVFMGMNNAYGKFGPSRLFRTMVKDKVALRESVDRILALDPDRIVTAHGDVLESGGKAALEEGFSWL